MPTALVLVAVAAAVAPASSAGDGSLDPTFSGDGVVTTDFGDYDVAHGIAVQRDGKIVVAGSGGIVFDVARYRADGTLDPTFSDDGKQSADFGGGGSSNGDVVVQGDGKIVVAGSTSAGGTWDFGLVRYLSNGTPDSTFSGDGKVTTDFGGSADYGLAVALQADGKIVVAGYSGTSFAVARYDTHGVLDPTFSGDGMVTTSFADPSGANAIAVQSDGKIVVAGYSGTSFAVARYDTHGVLDPTFSGDGMVTTDFPGPATGWAVVVQPDEKIVVAGQEDTSFALARYTSGGILDPTFSGDGLATTDVASGPASGAFALALQSDGMLVAAGRANRPVSLTPEFGLARYRSDGTLDPTFAGDGTVLTDLGGYDVASAVAIQPDGQILAAGTAAGDFAVVRYRGPDRVVTIGVPGSKIRLHHRHARLALACPSSEISPPCTGTVSLRTAKKVPYGRHRRKVVLARQQFSIAAGTTPTVRLHLSKRKTALVEHLRKARKVTVTIQVGDAAGNRTTMVTRMKIVVR